MSARREVVSALGRLGFACDVLEEPGARGWNGAAWTLRKVEGSFEELYESGALAKLPGVGKGVLSVVRDVIAGQTPEALRELEARLPAGLFAVGRIKGLGGKKVRALWTELGIESLGELEYACRENRLVDLKGFGSKTQSKVLEQIQELRETEGMLRRDQARRVLADARRIAESLEVTHIAEVGEYVRGAELVDGVAILLAGGEADTAAMRLRDTPGLTVHVAEVEYFGAAQVRLTSSAAHVAALEARGELEGESEEEVYEGLGLHLTPPERREAGVPLVLAGSAAPRLIRREDLAGALHNHTTASDGTASLAVMREAAARAGLTYLGISEHSQAAAYARGLDEEELRAQCATLVALNAEGHACTLVSGIESDILAGGDLDYPDEVLASLEVVIASVHQRFRQNPAAMTARMVHAAAHPRTDVVGHPTGRLLLSRPESGVDMEALLDACAASGCAVELNCNPQRLDLSAVHLGMAKERGVLVSIAADAHAPEELENLEHGITLARRAGLTSDDVLNARPLDALRQWSAGRRP